MQRFFKARRAALGSKRKITDRQGEVPMQVHQKRKRRRRLLARGLGVAAVTAGVGAGALLEMNGGGPTPAHANGTEGPTTFNNNGGSTSAVTAISSNGQNAILGTSSGFTGIAGKTSSASFGSAGVYGQGPKVGVSGQMNGANTRPTVKVGVYGTGSNGSSTSPLGGIGVEGDSDSNNGILGTSITNTAIAGKTNSTSIRAAGVFGQGGTVGVTGYVQGASTAPIVKVGVYGSGSNGPTAPLGGVGVEGESDTSYGVYGISSGRVGNGAGIGGFTLDLSSVDAVGVRADGGSGYGVYSTCDGPSGWGVYGEGDSVGVYGNCVNSGPGIFGIGSPAGEFSGDVNISGTLTKGGGSFKIDHPLDPANKFLSHSFVESPDMKNVYDGLVTLDAQGEAVVTLPAWFEVLNKEFRYQLTPIGAPGPNLYISAEVSNLSFKIAGGTSGMKVSWQVTGIRQDAWAQAHPIVIEQDKSSSQRGHYLHPELYGHPSHPNLLDVPVKKLRK